MRPKIKDQAAWQQAELLMQPVLIRLLDNIRKKLEESVWKGTYHNTETPYPGYRLDLQYNDRRASLDVWELCYRVCFKNYQVTHAPQESLEVDIDTSLIDETGEVDWNRVDEKARRIIDESFENLPNEIGESE